MNPDVWWNCRHEPVSITCRMRKPCYGRVQFVLCLLENKKIDLFRIPVNKGTNARLGWTKYNISYENRPFTANHVVQNRHAGEQKSHWDKTNKGNYHLELCMPLFVLSHCDFCSLALRFVPPEWLAAKGLFTRGASIWFLYVFSLERNAGKDYSQLFSCDVPLRSIIITSDVLYR